MNPSFCSCWVYSLAPFCAESLVPYKARLTLMLMSRCGFFLYWLETHRWTTLLCGGGVAAARSSRLSVLFFGPIVRLPVVVALVYINPYRGNDLTSVGECLCAGHFAVDIHAPKVVHVHFPGFLCNCMVIVQRRNIMGSSFAASETRAINCYYCMLATVCLPSQRSPSPALLHVSPKQL